MVGEEEKRVDRVEGRSGDSESVGREADGDGRGPMGEAFGQRGRDGNGSVAEAGGRLVRASAAPIRQLINLAYRPAPVYLVLNVHPVSVNEMYRAMGRRVVLSEKGRAFKKEMANALMAEETRMIQGSVALTVAFYFKTRHRRDVDNFAKATLDSLKGVIFMDDSDVTELHLHKYIGAEADQIRLTCVSTEKMD